MKINDEELREEALAAIAGSLSATGDDGSAPATAAPT